MQTVSGSATVVQSMKSNTLGNEPTVEVAVAAIKNKPLKTVTDSFLLWFKLNLTDSFLGKLNLGTMTGLAEAVELQP